MTTLDRRHCARNSEHGGAFILTLLLLLLLTTLGLLVTSLASTEVVLGASDRAAERVLHSADSGLDLALQRALVLNDLAGATVTVEAPDVAVADAVVTTAMVPASQGACDLCQLNQGAEFWSITHVVTARGTRTMGLNKEARATVSTEWELQPRVPDAAAAMVGLEDSDHVRF